MLSHTRKWHWLAGAAVMLFLVACALSVRRLHRSQRFVVRPIAAVFPADGRMRAMLLAQLPDGGRLEANAITAEVVATPGGPDLWNLQVMQAGEDVEVWMLAPVKPEERRVRVHWRRKTAVEILPFTLDPADRFGDGMPDALRLHSAEDRAAFRQWFWQLAELQADLPDAERAGEIQDCAALLRYAYREALKAHDTEWAQAQHLGDVAFDSVHQWRYPQTMLGTGLFRIKPGPFVEGDERNGAFAQFADAHALMEWNTYRAGRNLRAAKPGDLIFYRQLEQNSPYHSMVITGSNADWVVYHTGPIGNHKGEMRRMKLSDLLVHPDARWRPLADNSNFLGVFRWNVLREGD